MEGNNRSLWWRLHCNSCYALQGMAGNIIHAIATTNAIVSGLIVVEAMKILAGKPDSSKVGAGGGWLLCSCAWT